VISRGLQRAFVKDSPQHQRGRKRKKTGVKTAAPPKHGRAKETGKRKGLERWESFDKERKGTKIQKKERVAQKKTEWEGGLNGKKEKK